MKKRYLVYLSNKQTQKQKPNDSKDILQKLRLMLEIYSNNEEIRDIRVSSYFLELDIGTDQNTIFLHNNEDFLSSIRSIGECLFIEDITEERKNRSTEETISSAIFLFNMERFWKSHEVLENAWKDAFGSTKRLLNGIILVDAAYVHLQKGELDIYFSILRRSLDKFREPPEVLFNINMKFLVKSIENILSEKKASYFKIFLI
ncbi:MAG TPA: DUF309 domain-containing protein [Candidatus Nitrosocosmicus sp.]|nr:DUF309 domain-containing protein [Candidatus Nitrosocosmicus sp.]